MPIQCPLQKKKISKVKNCSGNTTRNAFHENHFAFKKLSGCILISQEMKPITALPWNHPFRIKVSIDSHLKEARCPITNVHVKWRVMDCVSLVGFFGVEYGITDTTLDDGRWLYISFF